MKSSCPTTGHLSNQMFRLLFIFNLVLITSVALSACKSPAATEAAQRYDLKGKVVSVDKAQRRVVLDHEEVRGFMEPMTMPFNVLEKDAWALDVLKPGDRVTATLAVSDLSSWIENIVVSRESEASPASSKTEGASEPKPGDAVPDYQLTNQDGKRISLHKYRGKALLVTFIYTRCPLPDYCTLMSNNFAEIDRELRKNPTLYPQTHLLSITVDPDYDTPKVMRSYGASHTGKYGEETFTHWEFATGTPDEIKSVAKFFGLTYFQDKDQIIHNLSTAMVAPDGKLFKLYKGNEWKPSEVLADVQKLLDERKDKKP
jgi:protein SCO1/2